MANLVKHSDFTGKYQITQNTKVATKVSEYINKFQNDYVFKILGATLGQAFLDDLDVNGVPVTPKFQEIYNAFAVDDDCGLRVSGGFKEIMLGFIAFELKRDANFYNSLSGNKRTVGENSEFVDQIPNLTSIFNDSIASAKAVQWYVDTYNPNAQDYSDFNGQPLDYLLNF